MENKIEHNTPDPRRLYTKLEEAIALDQGDIQLIPLELRGLIVKDAEDIRLIREMIELILLEKPELFIRFFEVK